MWPFPKKALTADAGVLAAIQNSNWQPFPLIGGGNRQRIQDVYNTAQSASYAWMYTNSPAVRTVIDVIARNVGQLDLRLYEEVNDADRQPKPDHPAALSLRYPNEDTPADSFIRSLFLDFLIYNNAYSLMLPAPGNQLHLEHLPAGSIEVRGSSIFRAEAYRYWRIDGTWIDFTPDQILHWRGENPHDPRVGFSPLETLRSVIAEDAALAQATVELANSGLTQPVYGYRPVEAPVLSEKARKGMEEDLGNRMRGANRRPFVLEEGTELKAFGVSPRDAQMIEIRKWAIERVATLYGVPLGMVGLADKIPEAQTQFYADTLPPYCEQFTKMLNQRVLVRAYGWTDGCFEFNLDEKHMGDDRVSGLVSATGRPIMTTNEGRAKLNLPPIDGGDELVTPLNVTEGSNPKPSTDVMPIQDPNGPAQDGSHRDEPQKALVKAGERLPQLHPGRKADLTRQHRNIDLAQGAVGRYFNRLERSLREKNRKSVKATRDDWRRWAREFSDDLHTIVEQIVEKEGEIYVFKLAGDAFDMAQVRNYLRAMAEGVADGITSTVKAEVEDMGLDEALARKDVHVASAGASIGAGATRWAREEAARQAPGTSRRLKTWIANTERHAEFAGDTVPLGDDWPAGFAPGSAPGCSCSMSIT